MAVLLKFGTRIFGVLIFAVAILGQECDDGCDLPYCRCPSKDIPNGHHVIEMPIIILVAYHGPVEVEFLRIFNQTFPPNPDTTRRNPNGCPMTATIFARGLGTDSCVISRQWAYGHEIGVGGYEDGSADRWIHASSGEYQEQITETREILLADIPLSEKNNFLIRGSRQIRTDPVPAYFEALDDLANYGVNIPGITQTVEFEYDSTITVFTDDGHLPEADTDTQNIVPVTLPWTMDNLLEPPMHCGLRNCPTVRHDQLWEIPLSPMYADMAANTTMMFTYVTSIIGVAQKGTNDIFHILRSNFDRHVKSSRAPFVINFHTDKLVELVAKGVNLTQALNLFLDEVANSRDDAWVLSMHHALQWMKDPRPLDQLYNYEDWDCLQGRMRNFLCSIDGLRPEEDEYMRFIEKTEQGEKKEYEGLDINSLFPEGYVMVYWQTGLLAGGFFLIYLYDKYGMPQ